MDLSSILKHSRKSIAIFRKFADISVDLRVGNLLISRLSLHFMALEVQIRKGEPTERALRRLKKKLDREGVIRDVRAKRYFEKPCQVRRRKKKVMAFTDMLRRRYMS